MKHTVLTILALLMISTPAFALPRVSNKDAQMAAVGACESCLQAAVNKLGGESVQEQAQRLLQSVVYGGEKVAPTNPVWRHTVILRGKRDGMNLQCSGSIIENGLILTAAHCLKNVSSLVIEFRAANGEFIKAVPADKAIAYAKWSEKDRLNDIGLVKFSGGLPNGFESVERVEKFMHTGDKVVFAGFGKTENGSMDKLNYAEGKVHLTGDGLVDVIGKKQANLCNGDSGGPAFTEENGKMKLFGINKSSPKGCVGDSSTFTEVVMYDTWIMLASKKLNESTISHN